MVKQPYMPLYTGDWKKDEKLSMCSLATRGAWIDLLFSMHEGRVGQVTGTAQQLARICRCDPAECIAALHELQATGAAVVSERDGIYTVICRRLKRKEETSKLRAKSGSKGGSKSQANKSSPEYEDDIGDEGLERVREFAKGAGIPVADADWFFWKGRASGWTNAGQPIKDWKATLRCWFRAGYCPSQKQGRNGAATAAHGFSSRPSKPPRDFMQEEISNKFKTWALQEFEKRRDEIATWKVWADVPPEISKQWRSHLKSQAFG